MVTSGGQRLPKLPHACWWKYLGEYSEPLKSGGTVSQRCFSHSFLPFPLWQEEIFTHKMRKWGEANYKEAPNRFLQKKLYTQFWLQSICIYCSCAKAHYQIETENMPKILYSDLVGEAVSRLSTPAQKLRWDSIKRTIWDLMIPRWFSASLTIKLESEYLLTGCLWGF